MRNDPTPSQLTVGQLRAAIANVADEVVVALALSPSTPRHEKLTLLLNVETSYPGGALLQLHPSNVPASLHAPAANGGPVMVAAAGNVVIPAVLALESQGFAVACNRSEFGETWIASRGDLRASGDDPIQVLGLITLLLSRGENWQATDSEIADATRRFALE